MRRYLSTILILLLAGGGALAWRAYRKPPSLARVPVGKAVRGEFVVSLVAEGPLESDTSVVVRTGKAPGELTSIVPDGTVVKTGDVFCKVESRDLLRKQADASLAYEQASEEIDQTREQAEQRLESAQRTQTQAEKDFAAWEESTGMRTKQTENQLVFDRAEAERLRLEADRSQRMAAKGYQAASEAEVDKAAYEAQQFKVEQSLKDLELNKRQIAAERRQRLSGMSSAKRRSEIFQQRIDGQVRRAQHHAEVSGKQLKEVTDSLADTTIRAPASGTVSLFTTFSGGERRSWRAGDQVASGTPLGTVSGSENMSVRCRIRENSIGAIRKGQDAEIEFQALAGRRFTGSVTSVGTVAREVWVWEDPTAEANERVFDVVVKVKQDKNSGLKPGLNAQTRIIVKRLPNVTSVPLTAVFERSGKSVVYVKQGEQFVRREVEAGERSDTAVEVRRGLAPGDVVALADPTRYPERGSGKSR